MSQIGIAVERVRAPQLWGQPVALTDPDNQIVCVSDEGAERQISAGTPVAGARVLCPDLIVLPYDRPIYEQTARSIWDALALESSRVEPVSPEICYLTLDGHDALERLRLLHVRLTAATRFSLYIGAADSKLVAYHAAKQACPECVNVGLHRATAILATVAIAGCGHIPEAVRKRLGRLGIRNFREVRELPPRELERAIGAAEAAVITRLADGRDGDAVRAVWPPMSLRVKHQFDCEIADNAVLVTVLDRCARHIARRLQARREFTRALTLRLVLADETECQEFAPLAQPMDLADRIANIARRLLARAASAALTAPVTAVELEATDLSAGSGVQLQLLDLHSNELPHLRLRRLNSAINYLRNRFGPGAVVPLCSLYRARRIDCWIYPLCHQRSRQVHVSTNSAGEPVDFTAADQLYRVTNVHRDWDEAAWAWETITTDRVFRVETIPSGYFELRKSGNIWRICAVHD